MDIGGRNRSTLRHELYHIYKKWNQYNPLLPLGPWVGKIINNQIINIARNIYTNHQPPCTKCAAAESANSCRIYGERCSKCPLYAHWLKSKKNSHDVKMTLALDYHTQEVFTKPDRNFNIDSVSVELHKKMKSILKPIEWKVYKYLYIDFGDEEDLGKLLGYKSAEKNRHAGYKTIKNIKRIIIDKAKQIIYSNELEM